MWQPIKHKLNYDETSAKTRLMYHKYLFKKILVFFIYIYSTH